MDKTESSRRIVLKEGNYITWVTAMEAELRHIGCWKFLEGTDINITEEKKEKSYCLIMRHLDESIISFIGNKISPEEKGNGLALWNILKEKFVGSGVQAMGVALDRFLELKFKNVDQWIEDLRTTTRKLALTGTAVNSPIVSRLAIRTLPAKYESLIRILTYGDQYPTIEDIITSVEKDRSLFQIKNEVKEEVALPSERETRSCYHCGKKGHIARNCRNRNNYNNQNKGSQARIAENEEEDEPTIAFVAISNKGTPSALVANKKKQTILDLGANDHMFASVLHFKNLQPSYGAVQIGQEGIKIPIKGKGDVIQLSNNKKIIFKNALYVPDLP
ncbi:hypothetical protein O181_021162 [Austropuccinia psidii MF-1]|uniref:CCHC-type domain-containing protein n=1 Tax=Austropuccinia psidii MF-1 TaxID=1389203 RepID=A0A9Q3CD30_9BASI|nr:hypothetical protein [Austropuccinia psidii MF-1]